MTWHCRENSLQCVAAFSCRCENNKYCSGIRRQESKVQTTQLEKKDHPIEFCSVLTFAATLWCTIQLQFSSSILQYFRDHLWAVRQMQFSAGMQKQKSQVVNRYLFHLHILGFSPALWGLPWMAFVMNQSSSKLKGIENHQIFGLVVRNRLKIVLVVLYCIYFLYCRTLYFIIMSHVWNALNPSFTAPSVSYLFIFFHIYCRKISSHSLPDPSQLLY